MTNITAFNKTAKTYMRCSRIYSMKTTIEDSLKCEGCGCEVDMYHDNSELCEECYIEYGIQCAEARNDLD